MATSTRSPAAFTKPGPSGSSARPAAAIRKARRSGCHTRIEEGRFNDSIDCRQLVGGSGGVVCPCHRLRPRPRILCGGPHSRWPFICPVRCDGWRSRPCYRNRLLRPVRRFGRRRFQIELVDCGRRPGAPRPIRFHPRFFSDRSRRSPMVACVLRLLRRRSSAWFGFAIARPASRRRFKHCLVSPMGEKWAFESNKTSV